MGHPFMEDPPGRPDANPPLATPRLRLEPQVRAHARAMMRVLGDPRVHLYLPTDPPTDEAALAQRFARLESRRSPDGREGWLNWTALLRDGGLAIGTVQATVHASGTQADVAYLFHPDAWGRGFAAEAVGAMLDHLRTGLGVTHLCARLDTRNARSRRLVERLCFTLAETVEQADEFKGSVSDEHVYVWAAGDEDRSA